MATWLLSVDEWYVRKHTSEGNELWSPHTRGVAITACSRPLCIYLSLHSDSDSINSAHSLICVVHRGKSSLITHQNKMTLFSILYCPASVWIFVSSKQKKIAHAEDPQILWQTLVIPTSIFIMIQWVFTTSATNDVGVNHCSQSKSPIPPTSLMTWHETNRVTLAIWGCFFL